MRRRVVRWCRSPAGVVAMSLLLTVVVAFMANVALNLGQPGPSKARLLRHTITEELPLFLLGALVVWLFVMLLLSLVGRLWLSIGIVAVVTGLIGFANYRKQQLVMEPLYPSDLTFLSSPTFLVEMLGVGVALLLLLGVAVFLGAAVVLGRLASRWFPRPDRRAHPRFAWALVVARCTGVVVSASAIVYLAQFHDPGNFLRATYEENGAHWRPWHQTANYTDNGFVAGMLYNLPTHAMRTPPSYGPQKMQKIVQKYSAVADSINQSRKPNAFSDVNVVFVLGEAFSDPTRIDSVQFAEDPIPFTRSLMKRTTSGNMWSPKYGGGTANVEFEALTGMSLSNFRPQMSTPYQMLVPDSADFPSAVDFFARQAMSRIALHSYTSAMYRRAEVYPTLGFQEAVFEDDMIHDHTVGENPFVSDDAAYQEILHRLEGSDTPTFVNAVTMQNHYPMAGKYDNPIPVTGLADETATENLEHYARGLKHSDDAMRDFIARLEASDEKTIVVFYGDHLPAVWPGSVLTNRNKHETPFFVYSNFGAPQPERLPTTSPIYFMNHVLELADAHVPPYYALLQRLEQEVPALLDRPMLIGPDNKKMSRAELPPRARQLLRDYRLVQYDLAVGERYGAKSLFAVRSGSHVVAAGANPMPPARYHAP